MKTTKLPSVEDVVPNFRPSYQAYEIANLLTQDRNQAYTSLVEGIEGMEREVSGQIDTPGYDKDDQYNQDLRYIIENVVKPLYRKE